MALTRSTRSLSVRPHSVRGNHHKVVDLLALVGEACAARLHDTSAGELPNRDAEVAVGMLAEDTLSAVRLIAGDHVITCSTDSPSIG